MEEIVKNNIEHGHHDTLPLPKVKGWVSDKLDVDDSTADNYIRVYCRVSKIDGERHVVGMKSENDPSGSATAAKSTLFNDSEPRTSETPEPDVMTERQADISEIERPVGERTGEMFQGIPVLENVGLPLVPQIEHSYITREQRGNTRDIENAAACISDPNFALLLEGEAGVGKDYLIEYLGSKTNRPVIPVNFGVGTTFEDLVGMYTPKPQADEEVIQRVEELEEQGWDRSDAIQIVTGAQNNFEFEIGALSWTVIYGGWFVGDEINAAGGDVTMPLHGITLEEGRRYLNLGDNRVLVDLPVTDEEIDRHGSSHEARVAKWDNDKHLGQYIHPEFEFIATMNPPKYPGVKPLNDAFRSRFWVMTLDYLPPEAEKRLLFNATPFDPDDPSDQRAVEQLVNVAKNLRDSYKEIDIVTPISHRETIKIGITAKRKKQADGEEIGVRDAAKWVLENISHEDDTAAINKVLSSTKFE